MANTMGQLPTANPTGIAIGNTGATVLPGQNGPTGSLQMVAGGTPSAAPAPALPPGGLPAGIAPPPTAPAATPFGTFTPPAGALPTAPSATPYADFVAPNPADVANDPAYQFRVAEANKAMQRSAAANGTLLTGGLQKSLARYNQGLASEEAANAFNRALQTYTANRDTNAQNFGQQHTAYGDALAGHQADFGNALAAYGANRDTNAANFGQQQDIFGDQLGAFTATTNAADTYGRLGLAMEAARGANPGAAPTSTVPAGGLSNTIIAAPRGGPAMRGSRYDDPRSYAFAPNPDTARILGSLGSVGGGR